MTVRAPERWTDGVCQLPERSETRTPRRTSFVTTSSSSNAFPRQDAVLAACNPPLHERRRIKYAVHPILSKSVHQYYPGQPVEAVQRSDWGEALCQKDRASYLWFGWHWPIQQSCLRGTTNTSSIVILGGGLFGNLREREPHPAYGSNNRMRAVRHG